MSSDGPAPPSSSSTTADIRFLPLTYRHADSDASALRIVHTLFPAWAQDPGDVTFTRFTDGITNTLLKAAKQRPGWSEEQVDAEAILIRAYGEGTEVLIDREREAASQRLLASLDLAPPLLARFQNGILYRFLRGRVSTPADLREPSVYRGVARRLGEWHARLPVDIPMPTMEQPNGTPGPPVRMAPSKRTRSVEEAYAVTPGKITPNVWTTMQRWVFALPTGTSAEQTRKQQLQDAIKRTTKEFADMPGLGEDGLVLSHCDLLSGNVIILPSARHANGTAATNGVDGEHMHDGATNGIDAENAEAAEDVAFIDYEYTTPAPAAFDLANHFGEFGGFECDYAVLPTKSTRRAFLAEYLSSYFSHQPDANGPRPGQKAFDAELERLCATVDRFRGVPGLYWGIWALIQATISQIDFDYAAYAEARLGEYWAWRDEQSGDRAQQGRPVSVRERRWAEE